MNEKDAINRHADTGWKMLKTHHNPASVEAHFKKEGLSDELTAAVMHELKKRRHAERSRYGSIMLVTGVLLLGIGFFSCVSLTNSNSSISFALYGLTTIGAIILIAGLVFLFH